MTLINISHAWVADYIFYWCADPSDPIRNLWQVNITDCSVPDAITVSIVDDPSGDRSDFNNANLNEVRLNCTDENAQVGTIEFGTFKS